MGGKFELGRIAGLPIVVDFSFILLILLWGQRYFMSGDTQLMSAGFVVVVGLAASILIHEFAHAVVGVRFGVRPSHVELNGLGGLCYWASPMRREAWPRIAISLAGPASNFGLYLLFEGLGETSLVAGNRLVAIVCKVLADSNFYLCLFNLLPAFPLDGGKALEAVIGVFFGGLNATRAVACIGLVIAALIAWSSIRFGMFMLLLAALLAITNWQTLQSARTPWRRD